MRPEYYGGDGSTDLGTVSPLAANDWPDLVKGILSHPVVIPTTRQKFHAIDKVARDRIKRVAFLTPATFEGGGRRVAERVTGFSLVALDIDDADHARPFWPSPDALRQALSPFGFAAYPTARSTPDAPRLRVFVRVAEPLPPHLYKRAVNTVAALLGLPSVTRESYTVHQPMYLPSLFRDEDPVLDHPLYVSDPEGRGLVEEDLLADDGISRPSSPASTEALGDLDHLRAQVDGVCLEDCRAALEHIEADCSYPHWLEVAAALRHQFPRDPEAEQAFRLFDTWSAKGSKYKSEEETRSKWKSLSVNPKGRAPVTVRTLIHRATEAGWDGGGVGVRAYDSIARWLHGNHGAEVLMAQGPKRIADAPLLTPLERGSLLADLQAALRTKGRNVSRTDLQAQLKHLEKEQLDKRGDKPTEEKDLPPWARGICYVLARNEFFHHSSGRRFIPEVLDNTFGVHLMTPDTMESGRPPVLPRYFLLNLHKIPRVDSYRYDPSHPEEVFVKDGKWRYINTYCPSYPESEVSCSAEAGALFFKHLCNLCGDETHARTVADFLAYSVQAPGAKIRWAVLLQGAQGCGKTFIADAMLAVLGKDNVRSVDASNLLDRQYNEWATGAQIVAMEEVRVAGHNRHDVMNKLKPLITNSTISIDAKFEALTQVPNCTNYLLFSNHRDALAISDDDRRYFVIHSPIQTKAQVSELGGEAYFSALYRMLREQAGGLRHWLENWKLSPDFRPDGHAPITSHQRELIEASSSPLMSAVRELLRHSSFPLIQPDLLSQRVLRSALELEGIGERATETGVASVLRELGFQLQSERYVDTSGERHKVWQVAARPHGNGAVEALRARAENGGML